MAVPARFPSGLSVDPATGPLGSIGLINPFFNHTFAEDFDAVSAQRFNTTAGSTGTVVVNPSYDGGAALFTTAATANDTIALQTKAATFAMVPQTNTYGGKRTAFLTRVQLDDVVNGAFIAGLMPVTATAFAPTDGIYFVKAAGSANNITLVSRVGGVSQSVAIPASAFTLTNNMPISLAFAYDGRADIKAFIGPNLVGYTVTSGTGTTTDNRGEVARLTAPITGVLMTPTLGLQAGTGAVRTMNVDYVLATRER